MALIGKIRNNMWLVFVVIALALLSFILMDSQGPGGGVVNDTTLGVVKGKKIDYRDFDQMDRVLFSNSAQDPLMRRAGLWDYFVNKTIIEDEAENIGLDVSTNELMELQFGQNLSPIIFQNYRNPQTGQVDLAQLQQIRQAITNNQEMNPGFRQYWAEQEKQVVSTQLQTKLNTIIQKALYTPTWMAEESFKDGNSTIDIEVVKIPFDDITAGDITLTDNDLKSYITKHKSDFLRKEEMRIVEYADMDVVANSRDSSVWKEEIETMIENFKTTDNDSLFAFSNNGNYQNYYAKPAEIQEYLRDIVHSLSRGDVYGPYISLRNYQAVKVVDKRIVPDSVSARHILIRAEDGNITQLNRANTLIDSLMGVYNAGTKFEDLAKEFSEDLSNKDDGGDLGYFAQGVMVPSFNDVCFINGKKGQAYKVNTQFGVHLIKIDDQVYNDRNQKYKLAYINVPIIPTKETQDGLYSTMVDLVGSYSYLSDLKDKVDGISNLSMKKSNPMKENDYSIDLLGPGNTSRDIVKFAFNSETTENDLSPEVYTYTDAQLYYNKKYVIGGLSKVLTPGLPSVDEVRDDIEIAVMNNKKAEKFIGTLSSKDIETIAQENNIEIDTVLNASLNNVFVAGLGNEPKVMGVAYQLEVGNMSRPVIGNSGVFVVRKIGQLMPPEPTGLVALKSRLSAQVKSEKSFKIIDAIREKVEIQDKRSIFF